MANEPRDYVGARPAAVGGPLLLLSAQQTTGAGSAFVLPQAYSAFGIQYYRGTTSATNESTAATVVIQGRIGSTASNAWVQIGANLTVNSATPALARSTNSIPVFEVRATISSFTTSAGAASTAERKIPVTVYLAPGLTGSS